jgi:hypothetical protein
MLRVTLALLLSLLCAGLVFTQATQSIQGLVEDSSGAVVAGAKVTMKNLGTGVAHSSTTNTSGLYNFPLVPVGDYEVSVELQGFKTETVRNIRVETAAQVRVDFKLEVGSVTETVEVTAHSVLLNTENPTVGGVIENKRIIDLPLNGRNVVQLAVLVPGVQFGERTGRGDGLGGFPIPGSSFSVSANGQRETHQVVSIDGIDAKDPRIHITNFVPSVEAIEEFKIQTNAYSAEYGFGGGANVQITMKSGTNGFHGTLFHFLRNDAFDAENYFLNFERPAGVERLPKDRLRRNQYGLVVSGPVYIPKVYNGQNKTFWAFNFERRRDNIEAVQTAWWPHQEFRNGDFSELLTGYRNPVTGAVRNPTILFDATTGMPFPNNIIPRSQLHAGSLNLLDQYVPQAMFRQSDPLDFTARAGVLQPIRANTYFTRVDHNFSDRDRIMGRLAWDRSGRDNNDINPNLPVFVTSKVTNVATQWIHSFSPTVINEFRFGFNTSDDLTFNPRTDNTAFDMDGLGVGQFRIQGDGNRALTPREHGIPIITGAGFTLQERTNGNGYDNMDTIQFGNHVSMFRGKHNLKMGGEVYYVTMERGAANLEEGRLSFGGNESGHGFASFLLGRPSSTETPEGLPLTFPRSTRWGAYIMDDWKLARNLTVNLGLRFDYIGVPYDAKGLWRTLDLPGPSDVEGRGQGYALPNGTVIPTIFPGEVNENGAVGLFNQRVRFFMPRVGITYRPTEKWVFRMGAGWFDNINHLNTWTIFNLMPPKSGSNLYQSVTVPAQTIPVTNLNGQTVNVLTRMYAPGQPILTLNDPFLDRSAGSAVSRPVNVSLLPSDTFDGDVWKWSFDVQRELPGGFAATIGYAGSKGTHVGNSIGNFNQAPPSSNTNIQSRRPYQQFFDPARPELGVQALGNIRYIDSYGESFYHGMQAKLDKRFGSGLALGIAYTLSKAHGDGENGGQEGVAWQDPLNRRANRGPFRFDQRHQFITHWVYELPGQRIKGPAGFFLGGWQWNGILSLRSGFPVTIGQGGDLNTGGTVRPDLLSDPRVDNPTRAMWYNPQAFSRVTCNIPSRPDLCRYGTAGIGTVRGPNQRNVDMSVFKNFNVTEQVRFQFRAEAVNAFNTPYFGDPGGIGFSNLNQLTPDGVRMAEIRSLRTPMRIMQFSLKLYF